MSKRLLLAILTILIIVLLTGAIVAFGRGYRFNFKTKSIQSTGLLVSSSYPTGAQVLVNNHLASATNSTIPLPPGTYEVRIEKDGYLPWTKKLTVQGEVVTKADALLLPIAPALRPITITGALNPVLSPDGTRIAFGVATASAQKQGIWVVDLNDKSLISFQSSSRQIGRDNEFFKLSGSKLIWSPDGKQILAQMENNYFLLDSNNFNDSPNDISLTADLILSSWIKEKTDNDEILLKSLKPKLEMFLKENTRIYSWSFDETKILYEATASASMPQIITPPLIGTNSQPEERELKKDKLYVYDIKEDKNFYIKDYKKVNKEEEIIPIIDQYLELMAPSPLRFISDSYHLVYTEAGKIHIVEYDGTNNSAVFSSPFEDDFVFPFPNTIKLVILTTLNPSIPTPNLYSLSLN